MTDVRIGKDRLIIQQRVSADFAAEPVAGGVGRLLHQFGPRLIIVDPPEDETAGSPLPRGAVAGLESVSGEVAAKLDPTGAIGLAAMRLRHTPEYIAAKANRPDENVEWDAPGALAPISEEAVHAFSVNQRLQGSVAVGIIIVSGPSSAIQFSDKERIKIVAEVQSGLGWLGTLNADAGVSWSYDIHEIDINVPPISNNWPGLPADFMAGIDAALWRDSVGRIYLFKGDQYVSFSNVNEGVDKGYPKPIAGNWPGLPANFNAGIDAALMRRSNGMIYLFKGDQYVRFSKVSDGVDSGYPTKIGLTPSEQESLWRDPAMATLGYPPGQRGVTNYVNNIRASLGTQWAYVAFFTKYPIYHSGYTDGGRQKVVMEYRNGSWGPAISTAALLTKPVIYFRLPTSTPAAGVPASGGTVGSMRPTVTAPAALPMVASHAL